LPKFENDLKSNVTYEWDKFLYV